MDLGIDPLIQKPFGFPEGSVELYAEKATTTDLCPSVQANSLLHKLLEDLVLRACNGVLWFIVKSGAKGYEVVVSGKFQGLRAKSMMFAEGLMIHSGDPVN